MNLQTALPKIFDILVQQVNEEILPALQAAQPLIQRVNYMYGPGIEMFENLVQLSRNQATWQAKYPLIMLVQDFRETFGRGVYCTARPRILIVSSTKAEFKSSDRYASNFEPILYPIWATLLQAIADSPYFCYGDVSDIVYTKTDRVSWGKEAFPAAATEFSDCLDAIEINPIELIVDQGSCEFLP